MNAGLAEEVSAASASVLIPSLPFIISLPATEAFERLKDHIHTALLAFYEAERGWGISEPTRQRAG